MQTVDVVIPRDEAKALYRQYKKHAHYSKPIDRECIRAFQLIAQGHAVIRAIESVKAAGLNEHSLPRLALCRADARACEVTLHSDGGGRMNAEGALIYWSQNRDTSRLIQFSPGTFGRGHFRSGRALLPQIPVYLAPKRGLANYHILREAEWSATVPGDPFLLRRIGKADLWLVVAAWDLTAVEKAALQTRVT
jgi:hypothetical protein